MDSGFQPAVRRQDLELLDHCIQGGQLLESLPGLVQAMREDVEYGVSALDQATDGREAETIAQGYKLLLTIQAWQAECLLFSTKVDEHLRGIEEAFEAFEFFFRTDNREEVQNHMRTLSPLGMELFEAACGSQPGKLPIRSQLGAGLRSCFESEAASEIGGFGAMQDLLETCRVYRGSLLEGQAAMHSAFVEFTRDCSAVLAR